MYIHSHVCTLIVLLLDLYTVLKLTCVGPRSVFVRICLALYCLCIVSPNHCRVCIPACVFCNICMYIGFIPAQAAGPHAHRRAGN